MAKAPRPKKPSLSSYSRERVRVEDRIAVFAELYEGTDRAACLVGCAIVDSTLIIALACRLIDRGNSTHDIYFYSPTAPLQTLSARIKMGRALGVYGAYIEEILDSVRRIRNTFAHSARPVSFADELVDTECSKLPDAKLDIMTTKPGTVLHTNRERYLAVCLSLESIFHDYAMRHQGATIPIEYGDPSGFAEKPKS